MFRERVYKRRHSRAMARLLGEVVGTFIPYICGDLEFNWYKSVSNFKTAKTLGTVSLSTLAVGGLMLGLGSTGTSNRVPETSTIIGFLAAFTGVIIGIPSLTIWDSAVRKQKAIINRYNQGILENGRFQTRTNSLTRWTRTWVATYFLSVIGNYFSSPR